MVALIGVESVCQRTVMALLSTVVAPVFAANNRYGPFLRFAPEPEHRPAKTTKMKSAEIAVTKICFDRENIYDYLLFNVVTIVSHIS